MQDEADMVLISAAQPASVELAAQVVVKAADKYDEYLTPDLLAHAYAARSLDIPNTCNALRELTATARPAALGRAPFAVVDVETSGFDALGRDRIVEIAIVRLSPEGKPLDRWTSLIDPERSPGPTHLHGIADTDLRGAPHFAEVADAVLSWLGGAVVVGHNAEFDVRFLKAELERAGRVCPSWPVLCTRALSYRLGSTSSRRLGALCATEGVAHRDQHSAMGDAQATAELLQIYLRRARAGGFGNLAELGVAGLPLPDRTPQPHVPVRIKTRTTAPPVTAPTAAGTAAATGDARIDSYLDALEQAFADETLGEEEVNDLHRLADALELDPRDVALAHQQLGAERMAVLT
jgi:ATP-dependent helicase Lhr and Lhr-like helicase